MKKPIKLLVFLCAGWMFTQAAVAQESNIRADWVAGYLARADSLFNHFADEVDVTNYSEGSFWQIITQIKKGQNQRWVEARLDSLMIEPRGDMFWMYPFTIVAYEGRTFLSEECKRKMREVWKTYMPFRGDTENHWAMYHASLYLMGQMYPDDDEFTWYTGKSSAENMAEAKDYLLDWMRIATTIGQGEYDSPDYLGVYISPMAMLYGYCEDPELKMAAEMMLDLIISDFAVDTLDGLYTGAHSRVYPAQVLEQWISTSTSFAWLFFGNTPVRWHPEPLTVVLSGYQLPEIIYHIATDRSSPFIAKEKKRTRHRIRNSLIKNAPVYKYAYMHKDFALGSTQGGLLQPIQQQTWDLTWAVDDPRGVHNTFFSIHPYNNPIESTMYFAEHWGTITELIVRSKTTFASPDKWTGGSAHEQVFQHKDALIALYDIPEGVEHPHIGVLFTKDLAAREVDASGWIFCRAGNIYFAWYPLAEYEWIQEETKDWRLHSPHLKNGGVLQVAPSSDFASFSEFKEAIRSLELSVSTNPKPEVSFQTLHGDNLHARYGETPSINNVQVDYDNWPFYEGPFINAKLNSRVITLSHGAAHRELDFNKPSIREWTDK